LIAEAAENSHNVYASLGLLDLLEVLAHNVQLESTVMVEHMHALIARKQVY
jgi:hypothetical protein